MTLNVEQVDELMNVIITLQRMIMLKLLLTHAIIIPHSLQCVYIYTNYQRKHILYLHRKHYLLYTKNEVPCYHRFTELQELVALIG